PAADQRDALAVLLGGRARQPVADVFAQVRGNALEPADRNRLAVHARAAARGLARAVARAAQDPREHVRLPVHHVRIAVAALRDQPDVLGDVGVGRARPLAIDDLVVVPRVADIAGLHGHPSARVMAVPGAAAPWRRTACTDEWRARAGLAR